MFFRIATALAFVLFAAVHAAAVPISGLYSTGVDDSGNLLAIGTADSHYSLMFDDGTLTPRAITPHSAWADNTDDFAQWINPSSEQNPAGTATFSPGNYAYQLTFDLTGFDPSTAIISGQWATDNSASILLNGNATGITKPERGFVSLDSFVLDFGFLPSVNTLTFLVTNTGSSNNPTGLYVNMEGDVSATVVPEPSTLLLFGIGSLGVWFAGRRNHRKNS